MQETGSTEDVPACFLLESLLFIKCCNLAKNDYGILQSGYYRSAEA